MKTFPALKGNIGRLLATHFSIKTGDIDELTGVIIGG